MSTAPERTLSAALIDIDGTLTVLGSVSWLDFTEQMWIMARKSIIEAKSARQKHQDIFKVFIADYQALVSREEKDDRIRKLNDDLFHSVWIPSGFYLHKDELEKVARASVSGHFRPDTERFLHFLQAIKVQLGIPVFLITAANSLIADVIVKDYSLSDGKASSEMIFDENGMWTGFNLDADLNGSKVRFAKELVSGISDAYNTTFVLGDGPTEGKIIHTFVNNAILSGTPIDPDREAYLDSDKVARYVKSLDEALGMMFDQLGSDAEKLVLPDDIKAVLRERDPN
jgi:hypothetical protein